MTHSFFIVDVMFETLTLFQILGGCLLDTIKSFPTVAVKTTIARRSKVGMQMDLRSAHSQSCLSLRNKYHTDTNAYVEIHTMQFPVEKI